MKLLIYKLRLAGSYCKSTSILMDLLAHAEDTYPRIKSSRNMRKKIFARLENYTYTHARAMRMRFMYDVTRVRFRNARNSCPYARWHIHVCLASWTSRVVIHARHVYATGTRDQQTVTMESVVVFGEA